MAAGGLGVLAAHAQVPGVAETAVHLHLLHALEVLAQLALDVVRDELRVRAVDDVALAVQHPHGDLELLRVLQHRDDLLDLLGLELTRAARRVDVRLLADERRKAAAHTLDAAQTVDDLLAAVDVRVAHTKNVREARVSDERHLSQKYKKTQKKQTKKTNKEKQKEKTKGKKSFYLKGSFCFQKTCRKRI